MAEEYVPFEEALKSLRMSEEELKRLVSQDEIQAVRDATGSIRLRKEDVEKLVQSETAELADDLVFADEDLDEADDTGMVTAVLEEDSLLEEEETLDLAPEEIDVEEAAPSRGRAAAVAAAPVRSKSRAAALRADKEEEHEGTLDRVLTIGTAVLLVYSLFFAYSISQSQVTGLTAWLANMFK